MNCPATFDDLIEDGSAWSLSSDQVMGGVSTGRLDRLGTSPGTHLRLHGDVSTANNGGFIQAGRDLDHKGRGVNLSAFAGVGLEVSGNNEVYGVHLRTTDCHRPWQSYRASFRAGARVQQVRLPWSDFIPHRVEAAFDPTQVRRIGIAAIGRDFKADLTVSALWFYRSVQEPSA